MRNRASRTFPRRDVQQKRGFGSPDHKECETEKSRPGVSPGCVRSDGVQPLPKRRKTAKTSFLLHINEIERARRPRGARAKRGRHEGGEARTALAVGRMRGSQRASNADGREGRKVRAARRSRDEGSRTGTGTARCGRARRSQDAGDAGARGVRDAVARPGGCRAREVMARRLPYAPRGCASPSSSELVSRSDLPFVSGAMNADSTRPRITRPAAISMVGPMP